MVFIKPPLDGTLTLPELFDFHWFNNPTHPLFRYERNVDGMTGEVEVEVVTWSRAVRAIHSAAAYVKRVCESEYGGSAPSQGTVVAILANVDTFTYYVLTAGVICAGYVPFPLSPRNRPAAILHLLQSTGARHILVSSDPGVQRLVEGVTNAFNAYHNTTSRSGSVPNTPLSPAPPPWLMNTGSGPISPASPMSLSGVVWPPPAPEPLQFFPVPTFDYLFDGYDESFEPTKPVPHPPSDGLVIIGHSSGTMGLPKPIHCSSLLMISHTWSLNQGDDFSNTVWSCHSIPMFHSAGMCMMVWSIGSGFTITSFPPDSAHILPNPERALASACATGSNTLVCLPICLEASLRSPESIEKLKGFKQVFYAGAPLYSDTGDYLVSLGVKLRPFYGGTEFGVPIDIRAECGELFGISQLSLYVIDAPHVKDKQPEDWEYFEFASRFQVELLPSHDDVYELLLSNDVMKRSCPSLLTFECKGQMMYNTLDLMQRHPTKPGLWRVYGRSDEQLTLSTSEKTNPVPIELRLKRHPKVANAVVFGHGRFVPGVLVEIIPEHQVDPSNYGEVEKLRNEIWFYMDQINDFVPYHSRIVKEMLLLADPTKPLAINVNGKGLVRRAPVLVAYEAQIEEAYMAAKLSTPSELPAREAWELDECLVWLRRVVKGVMGGRCKSWPGEFSRERFLADSAYDGVHIEGLDDDTDLISTIGLNSIEVMYLQQTILSALHHGARASCRRIPTNFVYANPSIRSLGEFVMKIIVQGHGLVPGGLVGERIAEMEACVKRYTADLDKRKLKGGRRGRGWTAGQKGSEDLPEGGEVVMLTGSTGALGTNILGELVSNTKVAKVYAINRPDRQRRYSSTEAHGRTSSPRTIGRRHEETFQTYGLDPLALLHEKLAFIETDLEEELLGLDRELYVQLQGEVTCIIHAAWPSNPNTHLVSYEPVLAGTRNLLDFALGSSTPALPRFIFLSSMHIFSNWVGGPRSPESPNTRPGSALGQGYPESKWVAERIVDEVSQSHSPPLPSTIVRVGHICAGRNGKWGDKHCMVAMLKSAKAVGCFPRPEGDITSVPIHHAATAIVEIALPLQVSSPRIPASTAVRYLNLTHPRPVSAELFASTLAKHLGLTLVSYEAWLAAIQGPSFSIPTSPASASSSQSSSLGSQAPTSLSESAVGSLDVFVHTLRSNPAGILLLDYFRALYKPVKPYSKDTEALGFPLAINEKAVEAAPNTLGVLKELDVEREVLAWVKGWKTMDSDDT